MKEISVKEYTTRRRMLIYILPLVRVATYFLKVVINTLHAHQLA